jgi:hypothetical protein
MSNTYIVGKLNKGKIVPMANAKFNTKSFEVLNVPCEKCGVKLAIDPHHIFSQSKTNRKAYPEYIDHPDNIQFLCYDCHHNKPLDKWSEIQFCEHFGIKPRTKAGMDEWRRRHE